MKKKKDENTETIENVKKKSKVPIIAVAALVIVIASIGFMGNSEPESNETTVEVSATGAITKEPTTEQSTEEETMVTDADISPESFVNAVEEVIQGAVGSDEYITDVALTDDTLTISVDLSKADTTIVPLEDLAVARASSITDDFLELEEYEYLWNEVIINFGDLGKVKKSKADIIDSSYGKYFDITEIER
ncbi:MAG: hypothetical protein K2I80_09795 [Ruminococcus sp.]|nr:hypothetical protein [Ruminococcus sp.]